MGVDEFWCALWSSKPAWGVKSFLGGFDSHILPPKQISAKGAYFNYFLTIKSVNEEMILSKSSSGTEP